MSDRPTELEARQDVERQFHDAKYSGEGDSPRHYEANPTLPLQKEMLRHMGDLTGQRVLELGCGEGWCTVDLCRAGATVDSCDISAEAVRSTELLLQSENLASQCTLRVMAAEDLDYPDASFDAVFGFAILHHLEVDRTIREMQRVLKPGGYAIFAEPLQGNPLLRLYRHLTPQYRTPEERPFLRAELRTLFSEYGRFDHTEYYLLGQLGLGMLHVPGLSRLYDGAKDALWKLDARLMRVLPASGDWAWYTVFRATK